MAWLNRGWRDREPVSVPIPSTGGSRYVEVNLPKHDALWDNLVDVHDIRDNQRRGEIKRAIIKLARSAKLFDAKAFEKELKGKAFFRPKWKIKLDNDKYDGRNVQFCKGDWMSALANKVIVDHLEANQVPVDGMANVQMRFPAGSRFSWIDDKGNAKALTKFELDQITYVERPEERRLIIVEAKSGNPDHVSVGKSAAIRTSLDALFGSLNLDPEVYVDFFMLVPDPVSNSQKDRLKKLRSRAKDKGLEVVTVSELHATVLNTYAFG